MIKGVLKMDVSYEPNTRKESSSPLQRYKIFDDKLRQEIYAYACYCGDTDVASAFVWTNLDTMDVHPVLQASACLESLIKMSRLDRLGDAVQLLEYIHIQCPDVCKGNFYTNLYMDLKTKAATSELLSPVVCDNKEAQMKILDKYFDPEICSKAIVDVNDCTTDEERNFALHKQVRSDLLNLLVSEEDHRNVRSKIFDPFTGHALYRDLVAAINHFVSEVRQHIPAPVLVQVNDATSLQRTVETTAYTPSFPPVPKLHVQHIPVKNCSVNVKRSLFDANQHALPIEFATQSDTILGSSRHMVGSSSSVPQLRLQRINLSTELDKVNASKQQRSGTKAQDFIQKSTSHRKDLNEMSSSSGTEEELSKMEIGRVFETATGGNEDDDETVSDESVSIITRMSPRYKKNKVAKSDKMSDSSSESDIFSDHDATSDVIDSGSVYTKKLRSRNYHKHNHVSAASQESDEFHSNTGIRYQLRSIRQQHSKNLKCKVLTESDSSEESDASDGEPSNDSDKDSTEDGAGVKSDLKVTNSENNRVKQKQSSSSAHLVDKSLVKVKRHFKLNVENILPSLLSTESSDQQPSDGEVDVPRPRSRRIRQRSKHQDTAKDNQSEHKVKSRRSSSLQKKTPLQSVFSSDEDATCSDSLLAVQDESPSILGQHSPRLTRRQTKSGTNNEQSSFHEAEFEFKEKQTVSLQFPISHNTKDDTESTSETQSNKRRMSPRKRKAISSDTSDQSTQDESIKLLRSKGMTYKTHSKSPQRTKSPKKLRPPNKRQRRSQVELLIDEAFSGSHIRKVQLDLTKALITKLVREELSRLTSITHVAQPSGNEQSAMKTNVQDVELDTTRQHLDTSPAKVTTWQEFAKIARSQVADSDSMIEDNNNRSRMNKRRRHHRDETTESVRLNQTEEPGSSGPEQQATKRVRFLSDSDESDNSAVLSETDQQLFNACQQVTSISEHGPRINDVHFDVPTDNIVEVHVTTSSPQKSPQKTMASICNENNNCDHVDDVPNRVTTTESSDGGPPVLKELTPIPQQSNDITGPDSTPQKNPVTSEVNDVDKKQASDTSTQTPTIGNDPSSTPPPCPSPLEPVPAHENDPHSISERGPGTGDGPDPLSSPTHNDDPQSISEGPNAEHVVLESEVSVWTTETEKSTNPLTTNEETSSKISVAEPAPEFKTPPNDKEIKHPKTVITASNQLVQKNNDNVSQGSSLNVVLNDILSSNFTDSELDVKTKKSRRKNKGRSRRTRTSARSKHRAKGTSTTKQETSRRKTTTPRKRNVSSPKKQSEVTNSASPSVESPANQSPKPTDSSLNDKSPLDSLERPLPNNELSQPPSQPQYVVVAHSDEDMEHSMSQSQFNPAPIARFERLNRGPSQESETTVVSGTTSPTDSPCNQSTPRLYNLRKFLLRKC